jgi:methylmalonyl-CoA/ethylmalonyl-CoA epimerase
MNLSDATVGQLLIPVDDLDRGVAFYRDVLGLRFLFAAPDIQSVHSTLSAAGVRFVASPHIVNRTPKSELWLAEFTDPDGNQLALMSEVAVG